MTALEADNDVEEDEEEEEEEEQVSKQTRWNNFCVVARVLAGWVHGKLPSCKPV